MKQFEYKITYDASFNTIKNLGLEGWGCCGLWDPPRDTLLFKRELIKEKTSKTITIIAWMGGMAIAYYSITWLGQGAMNLCHTIT